MALRITTECLFQFLIQKCNQRACRHQGCLAITGYLRLIPFELVNGSIEMRRSDPGPKHVQLAQTLLKRRHDRRDFIGGTVEVNRRYFSSHVMQSFQKTLIIRKQNVSELPLRADKGFR